MSVERAQPWLGTIVCIRVRGLSEKEGNRAIEAAFEEIAAVHRHMSFHDARSDVSRLNSKGHLGSMEVHPYTYAVLQEAKRFSTQTGGAFDVTTGRELVEWNFLPKHEWSLADRGGTSRDIQLLPDFCVRFTRPLCLDLGGIAKGFAVDQAIARLRSLGCPGGVVNAGGDLRVYGEQEERIALRLGPSGLSRQPPVLALAEGSLASSSSYQESNALLRSVHVDGRKPCLAPRNRFVSVISRDCVAADALTKLVMLAGDAAAGVLRKFNSFAYMHDSKGGWNSFGEMPT